MTDWLTELKMLCPRRCYTLKNNRTGIMHFYDFGVAVYCVTGHPLKISKRLLNKVFAKLETKGIITFDEINTDITHGNSAQAKWLMAVVREIPGIGYSVEPRTLFVKNPPA